MAHSYQPRDMFKYMETPDAPTQLRDIYAEHVCIENALSDELMVSMYQQMLQHQILIPITITTGGGRNGLRFPDLAVHRGNNLRATIRDNNQVKLSGNLGGQPALALIQAYYDEHPDVLTGARPNTFNQVNLSISNFMWRYNHRNADGSFPKIPVSVEISHKAEAYNSAHPEWGAAKVEVSELEQHGVNDPARKVCTIFGFMWRKPNGTMIGQHENYTGPSMCPHACAGSPCYAPYPSQIVEPSGLTPNPRKSGKRGGKKDEGGGKKQKKKGGVGNIPAPFAVAT